MIETVPPGTILQGRYRIERVLGSGGFGHVYLALDLVTSQQYAVKEYLVTGTNGQEQLQHEANVLSQLHHPNLPAFHDAFSERGRYYVVLNYIEGNDLTDIIRLARQRNDLVPITRVMGWLLAICDAVKFLHNQQPQIIHRDIKPDNIRIMPDGTAILVDLGNAKAAADGARTLFFIRHQGTPGYAPQEQYPGGSGTDARSDVYALGGTLYFALTTQEPPSVSNRNQSIQQGQVDLPSLQDQLAKNPPEDSPEANAARQFRLGVTKPGKPVPRHSRHIAQLGTLPPEILARLNLIIQRAMSMKPKERYQSVAEFSHDLKTVFDALPNQSQPRTVDSHSTQPDLAMLYESLQEQQEQAQGQQPGSYAVTPDRGSPVTPVVQTTCPRCGEPLTTKSVFCPHCGSPLTGAAQSSQPVVTKSNSTPPPAQAQLASHQSGSDQTIVVTPRSQQKAQVSTSFSSKPQAFSAQPSMSTTANSLSSGRTPVTSPSVIPSQAVISGGAGEDSKPPLQSSGSRQIASPSSTGLTIGPRMLFVAVLIVLMLLVLIALLLFNQAHTGMHYPLPQFSHLAYRSRLFAHV